jgi:hypothetical protein
MAKGSAKPPSSATFGGGYFVVSLRDDPIYFESLGRFVQEFSHLEVVLWSTLYRYAGISANVAKVLLSGIRVDAATSLLRRLMELKPPDTERREN